MITGLMLAFLYLSAIVFAILEARNRRSLPLLWSLTGVEIGIVSLILWRALNLEDEVLEFRMVILVMWSLLLGITLYRTIRQQFMIPDFYGTLPSYKKLQKLKQEAVVNSLKTALTAPEETKDSD